MKYIATMFVSCMLLITIGWFCSFPKDIQVRQIEVKLVKIDRATRFDGDRAELHWRDRDGNIYIMYTSWPTSYSIGESNTYLFTR